MSRADQVAMCESVADQILALWMKMGGKYAEWTVTTIHEILAKRLKLVDPVASWDAYTRQEMMRVIGLLIKIKAGYNDMWTKQWKSEAAAREQAKLDRERVLEECYTWEQVKAWMEEHGGNFKAVEYFHYEAKVGTITYWRKRDQFIRLLTEREAHSEYEGYKGSGHTFDQLYEPTAEPGWDGTLYKRRFKVS